MNTCQCGTKFETKLAPCPDSQPFCCVAHFDKNSFVCPNCGFDLAGEIARALLDGRVSTRVGVAVVNTASISKLELKLGS